MNKIIELWFPNYSNNPGYVSKDIRKKINELTENFDIIVNNGYYQNGEKYIVELEVEAQDYWGYVKKEISKNFGKYIKLEEIEIDETYLGRVVTPNKLGFGIFIDIGLRGIKGGRDALLPLYNIRAFVDDENISNREFVKRYGLVDGLPIQVRVNKLEKEGSLKIEVDLDQEYIDMIDDWKKDGRERLIITKTFKKEIINSLKNNNLIKYIDEILSLDPLTSVIICDKKTRASGLLSKIGNDLKNKPIGIFNPK
jgi:hypothetical protein